MIKLKEPIRIKGKLVIPYYIKDGDVMCFDKNGKQLCLREEDFVQKNIQVSDKVQEVIPIIKPDKPEIIEFKKPEPEKKTEKKPEKKEIEQDNYIKDEEYI